MISCGRIVALYVIFREKANVYIYNYNFIRGFHRSLFLLKERRGRKTERGKMEDGRWKTEDGRWKTEDGARRSYMGEIVVIVCGK